MTVSSKDSFTNYFSGGSESFKGTAQSVSQTFLTGRILEFTTDRWPLQLSIQFAWSSFQARVQALKKIFPDYEDNAPTMSESAFNRMTYPRWVEKNENELESTPRPISEPPSPVSTRPSSPERRSRPSSPGARCWHWSALFRNKISILGQSTAWTATIVQVTTRRRSWMPWILTKIRKCWL